MRLFRTRWLKRISPFFLLALLCTDPFGLVAHQADGKDELVIHAVQFLAKLSPPEGQLQIKYGFDAVPVSVVPVFAKIISNDYTPGTSFDPLSAEILTYLYRGPPRLITIL
jgi:hypothetical protein